MLRSRKDGFEAEVFELTVNACVRSRVASIQAEGMDLKTAEGGWLEIFKLLT
jgi:hypothetical protein